MKFQLDWQPYLSIHVSVKMERGKGVTHLDAYQSQQVRLWHKTTACWGLIFFQWKQDNPCLLFPSSASITNPDPHSRSKASYYLILINSLFPPPKAVWEPYKKTKENEDWFFSPTPVEEGYFLFGMSFPGCHWWKIRNASRKNAWKNIFLTTIPETVPDWLQSVKMMERSSWRKEIVLFWDEGPQVPI